VSGQDTFCRLSARGRCGKRPRRFAPRTHFKLLVQLRRLDVEFWFQPGVGYSPISTRRPTAGGPDAVVLFFPVMVTRMKKPMPQATQGTGPTHLAPVESIVFGSFPNIMAHLTVVRYDDGTPRQPGTIFLRTLGAAFQITATAPDAQCRLPVVGNTIDDALAALDLMLGADDAPWEIDPYAKARERKDGKKKS